MTQAFSRVIADSISPEGIRITTFHNRYWRPIHSEFMTHRLFSRNAGSSRARPSAAIIKQVRDNPWGPIHWGANQPGMQADIELTDLELQMAKREWQIAAELAANSALHMTDLGVHKQIVNRLLEPFTYIDVLVTSTDYANWFALRDHKDAQPEIQEVARLMRTAMNASTPQVLIPGQWHLPYIDDRTWDEVRAFAMTSRWNSVAEFNDACHILAIKVSVARCARVSYKAFDGSDSSIEKDLDLYDKLLAGEPLHASPAEHQATPDALVQVALGYGNISDPVYDFPHQHGNFRGWRQYRKMLNNEFVPG